MQLLFVYNSSIDKSNEKVIGNVLHITVYCVKNGTEESLS
jgi:hypothetical protein